MVLEGLKAYGEIELARQFAEKYFNAVTLAYQVEKTIKEGMLADEAQFCGASEFVGWGGLGPIANFIEYILGLDISVPEGAITWHISRTERHGIQNLKFGGFYVQLICEARNRADDTRCISIESGGAFKLKIVLAGKTTEQRIEKGTVTLQVG
jgi:hypothetical protein